MRFLVILSMEKQGLYDKDGSIPLVAFDAKFTIIDLCAQIDITQKFQNSREESIEAMYALSFS